MPKESVKRTMSEEYDGSELAWVTIECDIVVDGWD